MFFTPKSFETTQFRVNLKKNINLSGIKGYPADVISRLSAEYGTADGGIDSVTASHDTSMPPESYKIMIDRDTVSISHADSRGLIYAAVTLKQLLFSDGLYTGTLYDQPDCSFRGYRVFLPGRNSFDEFYDMIDTIVYYKYNYISFEIGGAMEYKRHPEINEKWAEFAAETHRYSDRTHEIQNGFDWAKNSIHTDNGEGDILTQNEVRQLIDYCRYRGLEVYPEVPTLSHTDYICMAHPQLAERAEDPYPDTYCPSNPDTYKIVFDILEEVIDVFEPKLINIGHDEYYSMCLCDRCKDKRPYEVFARDVIKIHDFLADRGIKTCMWGDKLLPVVTPSGKSYGGAGEDRLSKSGKHRFFPPTFQCQCILPKDIMMIHWYYGFGMQYDLILRSHGYPTVFGNMAVDKVENWRMRKNFGLLGGSCSNWGSNRWEYLQRNNQYINIIMGAYAMWSDSYDSSDLNQLRTRAFDEAYLLHYGNTANGGFIEVTHTTDLNIPYKVFYDGVFIEDEKYHMGRYRLTYSDGDTAEFEVKYGTNISNDSIPCSLGENDEADPALSVAESALGEVSYSTIPRAIDGRTWYKTAFKNPHPEKAPLKFEYISDNGNCVSVRSVNFN